MSDKSKRKGNPRRRFLFQILLITGAIAAVISAGIYVLTPKGAQIVFIAPDDEGLNQIWTAYVNNPENPRQLTTFAENITLVNLYAAENSNRVVFHQSDGVYASLWTLNPQTGQIQQIRRCEQTHSCTWVLLSPDGNWLAIEDMHYVTESSHETLIRIVDLDGRTDTNTIFTIETSVNVDISSPLLGWIGDTVVYRPHPDTNPSEIAFYDAANNEIVDTGEVVENSNAFTLEFSSDGTYYNNMLFRYGGESVQVAEIYAIDDAYTVQFSTSSEFNPMIDNYGTFQDWHPDSQQFLSVSSGYANGDVVWHRVNHHNIEDNSTQILIGSDGQYSFNHATYNHDGSKILYYRYDTALRQGQFMIYDVETGEETALPLSGTNPKWVNRGR